jgi:lysophospholipase L1-like esterase
VALTIGVGAAAVTEPATAAAVEPLVRDHVIRHPARTTGITLHRPVRNIMLIGDSVVFDHGLAGGRSNSIVPLVSDVVHRRFPEVTIDNRAARGLSTLHAINPASPTLRPYLSTLLDDTPDPPDLILIAVSAIDLNLFPDVPVATLSPPLIAELDSVRDLVEAHGVQVAFLPAFGASETMYERYRSLSGTAVPPYPINHRIDSFNDLLAGSDLPLLFRRFAGFDSDHDGDTDERFFVGHDVPESGSPDDGVHPNGLGERIYADNLARALITPLERRMTRFARDAHDGRRRRHDQRRVDGTAT